MKHSSKKLVPLFIFLLVFTVTGCSKKQYPKAEYHKLTGGKAKPYQMIQAAKTDKNILPLGKKLEFTLAATDSVLTYQADNVKIYSNYKEFFADVVPNKNYRISLHTLPDTHTSRNKYLFLPFPLVSNTRNEVVKTNTVENKWATGAFEKPGLKRAFTFNSGNTDQVAILVCADNSEPDKKIYTYTVNFITFKYMSATTGNFYITIEEIKE